MNAYQKCVLESCLYINPLEYVMKVKDVGSVKYSLLVR